MKDNRGFSLIETLLVISLIAILAGIAAPYLGGLVKKNRIENYTKRIYSDLMNTRIMAVDRNMAHFVVFAFTSPPQYTVVADTNLDGQYGANDTTVLQRSTCDIRPFSYSNLNTTNPVPKDVTITVNITANQTSTVAFAANQLSFNGRGVAGQTGTICVTAANIKPSVNCINVNYTQIRLGVLPLGAQCNVNSCNTISQ